MNRLTPPSNIENVLAPVCDVNLTSHPRTFVRDPTSMCLKGKPRDVLLLSKI